MNIRQFFMTLLSITIIVLSVNVTSAQSKRYILLEHFTNTECSECKTKNDQFYTDILPNNLTDIIHISYHAPFPSNSSFFYSQNPTDSDAAVNYYDINKTPQIVMNGTLLDEGDNLIEQSTIDEFASNDPESPIVFDTFTLTDDGNGNYNLRVIIATEVAQPLGNYIIRTAVVESEVNYDAPNGETVHKNVMRKMLDSFAGETFSPPTVGNRTLHNYNFTADADWNTDNLYIISWIQNTDNQEVVNVASSKDFMAPLKSTITKFTPVSCFGGADGAIDIEVQDGVPPYTFLWSNGSTAQNLNNVPAGVYTVVVRDASGTESEEQGSVTEPAELIVDVEKEDEENENMNGFAEITIEGGNPQMINNLPVYDIVWSFPDGSTQTNITRIQSLTSGLYVVKVTDDSGCTVTKSVSIFRNIGDLQCEIVKSEPLCFGDNNGSIVVTCFNASPPLIYNWSDGQKTPDIFNIPAGTYTVVVTDAIGAAFTKQITLDNPPQLRNSMDITNETNDQNNGSACHNITGGNPPYSVSWAPVGNSELCITNLSADNETGGIIEYAFIVEDSNGCDLEEAFSLVPISTELRVTTVKAEGISCTGSNDGYIEIFVSGGEVLLEYDIDWASVINGSPVDIPTSPSNTPILDGLSEGTYQVSVTDDNNETIIETFEITEPSSFSIEITKQDVCEDAEGNTENGFAVVTPSGGVPPYSYVWNNGTADSLTNVSFSRSLTVTVYDANDCEIQESIFVDDIGPCMVGVLDESLNNQFELYPNLVKDNLSIRINDPKINQFTFKIMDIAGKTIQEKSIEQYHVNQQINLPLNHLSKGVYFGILETDGKIARQRFLKL